MLERFTDGARHVIALAQDEARRLNHAFLGTEHLLLALASGEESSIPPPALTEAGVCYDTVRAAVLAVRNRGEKASPDRIPFTPRCRTVIELSRWEARKLHHDRTGTEHLLLGLLDDDDCAAAQVLAELEVDRRKLHAAMLSLLDRAVDGTHSSVQRVKPSRRGADLPPSNSLPGQRLASPP